MTLLSRLLLAGGILVSTAAGAGNSDVLSWYLGVGIGQSRLDPDTGKTGYSVSDRYDTGFKVFADVAQMERELQARMARILPQPVRAVGYRPRADVSTPRRIP